MTPLSPTQLAVVASTFSTDARSAVTAARSAGFRAIQFEAITPQLDLTQLSQTGRREFRQILASNELALASLRSDFGPKGLTAGIDIDRLLARTQKILEAAKAIGTPPLVCIDIGPLPEPAQASPPKRRIAQEQAGLIIIPELNPAPAPQESRPVPAPDAAHIAIVDGALRELGMIADRIGVTIALRSELSSFAALQRTITAAGCPWFAVDFDPVALLRDRWSSDEVFSQLGSLIRHVRTRDANVGADQRTQPALIGRGSTNWPELLSNLDAAGFNGPVTIDPLELADRPAAAMHAAKLLRSLQ
jgi:sugar phosphate isomerase/epimerase